MRHKKLLTVMLAAVMAFSSIGCGGSKPAEGSAPAAESKTEGEQTSESPAGESVQTDGQKVEIRFTWWGDTKRNDMYNEICDRFEEANPDIKVMREPMSWSD